MSLFDLSGRLALVTGSSRGIGLAIARGLGRAGAAIVLNGREAASLDRARDGLAADGITAHVRVFDVTDPAAVEAGVEEIENGIGPIDILVNNAGTQYRAPLHEFPDDEWRRITAVNLDAVFYVGRTVARRMIPRRRGKIINIASATSVLARETIAPYTATKGAVKMLTKGMAADWARYDIQVNAIAPGYFRTEINTDLFSKPDFVAWVEKRTPAGRIGNLDELAGAAVFLASEASSFVSGDILHVDGGLTSVF